MKKNYIKPGLLVLNIQTQMLAGTNPDTFRINDERASVTTDEDFQL